MLRVKHWIVVCAAFCMTMATSMVAFAQEEAATTAAHGPHIGLLALAVAIGIGIAALGAALGQSRAVAAALEGISRNPAAADKVFVPMLLGLVFMESLVLFTWILMFMLIGKI